MRRVLRIVGALVVLLLLLATGAWWWYLRPDYVDRPPLPGTLSMHSLEHEGITRSWRAYVPSEVAEPPALVLVLHGSNMDGEEVMEWTSHSFDVQAEKHGFIAVYPDGYKRYWNDCRRGAGYPANRENIDDVGFLRALAEEMKRLHGLTRTEVFAAGISNGGHMVYRLAYEAPDLVDGIAALVANVPAATNLGCEPSGQPVATLIVNGTEDPINPYDGGIVDVFGDTTRGEVLSAKASAAYWANLAGYEGPGEEDNWPDRDPDDGTDVAATTWSGPGGKVPVSLVTVRGGGHTLPHPVARYPRLLGRTSHDFDTAEVVWRFFEESRRRGSVKTAGQ